MYILKFFKQIMDNISPAYFRLYVKIFFSFISYW